MGGSASGGSASGGSASGSGGLDPETTSDGGDGPVGGGGGPPDVADGLFAFNIPTRENDEQCGFCHGSQGEGTELGPEIQHPVEDFATWVVRNGREHPDYELEMPEFSEADVSQELLQEIFDFLSAFPQPTTGQALFLDYCANCHGADALGGAPDRPIIDAPEDEFLELVRNGHSPGEFGDRREFMPEFSQDQVSDAELTLIIEYVGSL
jgi:mono/diheme cytochrome c family protein